MPAGRNSILARGVSASPDVDPAVALPAAPAVVLAGPAPTPGIAPRSSTRWPKSTLLWLDEIRGRAPSSSDAAWLGPPAVTAVATVSSVIAASRRRFASKRRTLASLSPAYGVSCRTRRAGIPAYGYKRITARFAPATRPLYSGPLRWVPRSHRARCDSADQLLFLPLSRLGPIGPYMCESRHTPYQVLRQPGTHGQLPPANPVREANVATGTGNQTASPALAGRWRGGTLCAKRAVARASGREQEPR